MFLWISHFWIVHLSLEDTNLTQQLRQPQHLPCEHAQADENRVELADRASDVPWCDLSQVHGKYTEGYSCQGGVQKNNYLDRKNTSLHSECLVWLDNFWQDLNEL